MDDDDISHEIRETLEQYLDGFQSLTIKLLIKRIKANGWLTTTFLKATAHKLASDNKCDVFTPCDSFIKFYINNQMIGQTSVVWDTKHINIDRTFMSPKISKKAPVTIELMDYDSVSSDDMILSWNTNVDTLLNHEEIYTIYGIGENQIVTKSTWREEPIQFENDEEMRFYNQML